jgi:hypothetical protein
MTTPTHSASLPATFEPEQTAPHHSGLQQLLTLVLAAAAIIVAVISLAVAATDSPAATTQPAPSATPRSERGVPGTTPPSAVQLPDDEITCGRLLDRTPC